MQILEQHQHRRSTTEPFEPAQQRLEGLFLAALRRQLEFAARLRRRQRQQLGDQRHLVRRTIGEQRRQLLMFCRDRVVAAEPGGAFELADHRMERAVLVVRRAEIAQPRVRFRGDALLDRLGQPRLADPRLRGNQDDPPLAGLGLDPAPQQEVNLLVAANERRRARAQGLETAGDAALADDAPHQLVGGEPLQRLRAHIADLEQGADLASRRLGDDDRVRLGEALQAGCQVGRLADHRLLLRRPRADQVADDDEPGRDADAHRQRFR
jgi:hypothetical protein